MKVSQLTHYMKTRLTNCIFCGKPITDNQEFEYCSSRHGKCVAHIFIHKDCIPAAQRYIQNHSSVQRRV